MKIIFYIFIFLFINLSNLISADEQKCGTFDLGCKTKKFIDETKEFQKKGLEKSKEQIKKNKGQIKNLNPLKKQKCLQRKKLKNLK